MNNSSRFRLALSCFGVLSIAMVPIAHAEFKCDRPQLTRVDATACAKAADSIDSLRQYVSRTRMIQALLMTITYAPRKMRRKHDPARALQANPQDSVAKLAPPAR